MIYSGVFGRVWLLMWNEARQTWADKFTGTVVVRDPLFMQREQVRQMQGILEAR